jgi:hypothetical protein
MKTNRIAFIGLIIGAALLLQTVGSAAQINLDNLDWSVQYMIDSSQTDFGELQSPNPRNTRGLALSAGGQYLYAGYNNGSNVGEVRKIDLTVSDYIDASVARVTGVRGKSIAVDDAGRVYLGEGTSIKIYDGDFGFQYSIATTNCEGVTVQREGGTLAMYATDRNNKTVSRWALTESGGAITGAALGGLDGDGVVSVTGASSLRGLDIDLDGRIWMADSGANLVFRVNGDGTGLTSVSVAKAMDIGFDNGRALVTQYTSRTISVLDVIDMSLVSSVTVPWAGLELDPDGQSAGGALSGIVVLPGEGFYVSNETGQTADEKSTYGRTDGNSGWIGDKFYTDLSSDDNDPILLAVPEPATLSILTLGGLALLRRRRGQ